MVSASQTEMTASSRTLENSEILARSSFRNRPVRAAQKRVRINPDFTQLLDTVLGRLGFQLTCRSDVRNERQMDENRRVFFRTQAQLACGFQKRQGFDIADGSSDFDKRDFVAFSHHDG